MFDSSTSSNKAPFSLIVDNSYVYLPKPFRSSQVEDNLKQSQCDYQTPITEEVENIFPEEEKKTQEVKQVDDDDEYFGKLFSQEISIDYINRNYLYT